MHAEWRAEYDGTTQQKQAGRQRRPVARKPAPYPVGESACRLRALSKYGSVAHWTQNRELSILGRPAQNNEVNVDKIRSHHSWEQSWRNGTERETALSRTGCRIRSSTEKTCWDFPYKTTRSGKLGRKVDKIRLQQSREQSLAQWDRPGNGCRIGSCTE
jgi:hypothetical protein